MKKQRPVYYYILIFVLAQVAWFSLVGLWIYWYVTNYILLSQVGGQLSQQLATDSSNVFALVSGLILLVVVTAGMSLIFIYLNRQLHLNRMYDNFIANITHELKSPLSSIQLYLETMTTREVPQQRQQQFLGLMQNDVNRLNDLINSVLYLSGFENKKTASMYPHNYHIYNADTIIRELISQAAERQKIEAGAVHIKGALPCRCVVDKNWLGIVFDNLLNNARKYSEQELVIDVQLSCSGKDIIIDIRDNGIGIATKNLKRIFHKFQRLNKSNSPNVKGTGLGLYWVREIIKYHGGKVSAHSQGIGHGSTFRIALPVYKATRRRHIRQLLKLSMNKSNKGNNGEGKNTGSVFTSGRR